MKTLNYKKLKAELIEIYTGYIKNPEDEKIIIKSKNIYNKYWDADAVFDENTGKAIRRLVDVIYKTGAPKPSKEEIKEIIEKLRKA